MEVKCGLLGQDESLPCEMWRPNGTMPDPFDGVVLDTSTGEGDHDDRCGRKAAEAAPAVGPSSAAPPMTVPAPARPPLRMARRDRRFWNQSFCSARLRVFATSRVIRVGAMGINLKHHA